MNISKILEAKRKGFIFEDVAMLMRLKTPYYLAVEAVATIYETTPQQMRYICDNIRKNKQKRRFYYMEREARKRNTDSRNQTLKFRFYDLYEKDRVRLDDVIKQVAKEFFLSENKVVEIIRGALADGEFVLSGGDTIQRFNKPHRKTIRDKQAQTIVDRLKQEYEQAAAQ